MDRGLRLVRAEHRRIIPQFVRPRHTRSRAITMADPNPDASPGTRRQMEIYKLGLVGKTPAQPVSVDELGTGGQAGTRSRAAYDYLAGGAGRRRRCGLTARPSAAGGSCPGCFGTSRDATSASRSSGRRFPVPLMLAPIGVQSILHKEAELAVARAAALARDPVHPEHRVLHDDGGRGRRDGGRAPLVPALLAPQRRTGGELPAAGPERRATARSS